MTANLPLAPAPSTALVHVAAASEERGRIVVALRSPLPGRIATGLAIDLARLFSARIEAVYLQQDDIFAAAAHPFACEIGFNGRAQGPLDASRLRTQCLSARTAAFDAVVRETRNADVAIRTRTHISSENGALSQVCADEGPWNIVVMADMSGWPDAADVEALLGGGGATALVLAGRNARRRAGPPLMLVSEPDRLPAMLRTSRILSEVSGDVSGPALMLPLQGLTDSSDDIDLDGTLRLALAAMPERSAPRVLPSRMLSASATADIPALEMLRPGFILAHTTSGDDTFRRVLRLISIAGCPAIVVH